MKNKINLTKKIENNLSPKLIPEMEIYIDEIINKIKSLGGVLKNKDDPLSKSLDDNLNDSFMDEIKNILTTGYFKRDFFPDRTNDFYRMDFNKDFIIGMMRSEYVRHYGFVAINEFLINDLSDYLKDKKTIDAGAGNGFLSSILQKNDIDITPVDLKIENNDYVYKKNYCDIVNMDAVKYLKDNINNFDTVLLSWPPMNSFAKDILAEMKVGQKLIYAGEFGGCTADDNFFNLLDKKASVLHEETELLNNNYLRFPLVKDRIKVYEIIK